MKLNLKEVEWVMLPLFYFFCKTYKCTHKIYLDMQTVIYILDIRTFMEWIRYIKDNTWIIGKCFKSRKVIRLVMYNYCKNTSIKFSLLIRKVCEMNLSNCQNNYKVAYLCTLPKYFLQQKYTYGLQQNTFNWWGTV